MDSSHGRLPEWSEESATRGTVLVESGRLILRRPRGGDARALERVFGDPEMMHYLGGVWTLSKVAEVLLEWVEDWGVGNRWSDVLVRKDTLESIGTAGVTENTIPGKPGLELSWFVLPEHQRQGFATEITSRLLRFAFDGLGVERMVAETHPENRASCRVLARAHFECLGERCHKYDDLPGFDRQVLWESTRWNWQQGCSVGQR